jgi:hypothetical protein
LEGADGATYFDGRTGEGYVMNIHRQIHELEARLLSHEVRADEASLTALLADDFVEFGVSGNVWKKADVIADLKGEVFVMRTVSDFKTTELADGVVLATYLCSSHLDDGIAHSLRSSVWRRYLDSWQMVFHQGTRVTAQIQ